MPANSKLKRGQLSSGLLRNCSMVTSNRIFSIYFFLQMDRNITLSPMIWTASCMANVDGSIWTLRAVSSLPRACGYWSRPKHTTFLTRNAIRMLYVSLLPHKATHVHLGPLGKIWSHRRITEVINSLNSKGYFIQFDFGGHRNDGCKGGTERHVKFARWYSSLLSVSQSRLRGHANLLYSILCHRVVYIYRAIRVNQQP